MPTDRATGHLFIQSDCLTVQQVMQRLQGPEFSPEMTALLMRDYRSEEQPFDEALWVFDPAPISQIKKIVNALYHAEKIALILDSKIALGHGSYANILCSIPSSLYQDVPSLLDHVYQMLQLLTHVEVDFSDLFHQELAAFMPLIPRLQTNTLSFVRDEKHLNAAQKMGALTGHGVMPLRQMNYLFLTQLGLLLPGYLARITTYVDACATDAPHTRTNISAPAILEWFEGFQIGGISLSNHSVYLYHVRPFFALQADILNELAHLNAANAHFIQEKWVQLKDVSSTFIACVDELECALMLAPGLLSAPLMGIIDTFDLQCRGLCIGWGIDWVPDQEILPSIGLERCNQAYRRHAEDGFALEQLDVVQAQCHEFFNTLHQYEPSARLSQLDDAVKADLTELFRLIQPYLAGVDIRLSNAIVKGLVFGDGLRLDTIITIKYALASHLSKESQTLKFRQRLNEKCIESLLIESPFVDGAYEPQQRFWLFNYQEKLDVCRARAACNAPAVLGPLTQDLDAEKRATRVLKTAILSEWVARFREHLVPIFDALNPAIQAHLKAAKHLKSDPPFPEINTYYLMPGLNEFLAELRQARELLPIKKWANALYFLEKSCKKLEQLDDSSVKIIYIKTCLDVVYSAHLAYHTLRTLFVDFSDPLSRMCFASLSGPLQAEWLALRLAAERSPSLSIAKVLTRADISSMCFASLSDSLQVQLFALQDHYQPGDPDAIFFIVNALSLFPHQIRAGTEGLPSAIAQAAARDVSAEIMRILESNGSLALFFEIPAVMALFHTMKSKVDDVLSAIRDSHATVMNRVGSIHRDVLTPALLKADEWEEKEGFRSGLVSHPMKQILDVYYQGLLTSLDLHAARHIQLATQIDDFVRRIDAAHLRLAAATHRQASSGDSQRKIDAFMPRLSSYLEYDEERKKAFKESFRATILPLLNASTPCLAREYEADLGDAPTMDCLNPDNQADREAMTTLLNICKADLTGQIASQQLARDAASDKIHYLGQQLTEQVRLNIAFKKNYMLESLHRQSERWKGVSLEHDQALSRFVQGLELTVLTMVEHLEDIDGAILTVLTEKMQRFEVEQGIYYQQLAEIKKALEQMDAYMIAQQADLYLNAHSDFSSGFESQVTLTAKRLVIEEIERRVLDQALPAQERLAVIQGMIQRDDFKTTLLAYAQYDALTYGWLVQCVASFFEWMGLYKPELNVAYERLKVKVGFFKPPVDPVIDVIEEPGMRVAA